MSACDLQNTICYVSSHVLQTNISERHTFSWWEALKATMYVISFIFSDARCIIFKDFQIASVHFVHFSRKMRNREDLSVNVHYNVSLYVVTCFWFLQ